MAVSNQYKPFDGAEWLNRGLFLGGRRYTMVPFLIANVEQALSWEGKKAKVYKIQGNDGEFALKAFRKRFATLENVFSTLILRKYAHLPGLKVCKREVVTDKEAISIEATGLQFSVKMPFIPGDLWAEFINRKKEISQQQCIDLARKMAEVLEGLENHGLAHADISATNVMVQLTNTMEFYFYHVRLSSSNLGPF